MAQGPVVLVLGVSHFETNDRGSALMLSIIVLIYYEG